MRNLLNFLIRYSTGFVFAFFVLLSCVLLARRDAWHSSVILTSANAVTGGMYETATNVTGYFNLRSINERLQRSNAMLENENLNLRNQLARLKGIVSDQADSVAERRYDYVLATVINNSTMHPRNYFTINKGSADGIVPGMGVVDQSGIVGIVNVAGRHTARIISLLNVTQHFSVRLRNTDYVGTLSWHGRDPGIAYMEDVPRHAEIHVGDSVVTTGFSTTFPSDLNVGTVMGRIRGADDNFYTLKVRLSSDFKALSTVRVIKDIYKNELDSLVNFDIKTE